jgi:transposase-like protein
MNTRQSSSPSETYVSISDVSRALGLPSSVLKKKVKSGTIKAVTINGKTHKTEPVDKTEPTLDDRETYIDTHFAELKGVEIMTAEAARKYDVFDENISRWVKRGFIKTIRYKGKRALLDESDVAYCVAVYRDRKDTGHRLFNDDGTPYTPKRVEIDQSP